MEFLGWSLLSPDAIDQKSAVGRKRKLGWHVIPPPNQEPRAGVTPPSLSLEKRKKHNRFKDWNQKGI